MLQPNERFLLFPLIPAQALRVPQKIHRSEDGLPVKVVPAGAGQSQSRDRSRLPNSPEQAGPRYWSSGLSPPGSVTSPGAAGAAGVWSVLSEPSLLLRGCLR